MESQAKSVVTLPAQKEPETYTTIPVETVLDVNYLSLTKMRQWDYPIYQEFQYDEIPDSDIQAALQDPVLENIDPTKDWEDDIFLLKADIPDDKKHSFRVASLVVDYRKKGQFDPIELDSFSMDCGFCIPNGHHRIRAYQFMKIDKVPFALNGGLDELEDLVELAGC